MLAKKTVNDLFFKWLFYFLATYFFAFVISLKYKTAYEVILLCSLFTGSSLVFSLWKSNVNKCKDANDDEMLLKLKIAESILVKFTIPLVFFIIFIYVFIINFTKINFFTSPESEFFQSLGKFIFWLINWMTCDELVIAYRLKKECR